MRAPLLLLVVLHVLAAAPARAVAPWPVPATYHLRTETRLATDRWFGARVGPVERVDLRQRLQLDVLGAPAPGGPRLAFVSDLEIGTDLGPPVSTLRSLPDGRRAVLDLYTAHLLVRDVAGVLDARIGRHVLIDALGFDALDGLTADLRAAPFLTIEASAGLAVRRGWADFGPDLYDQDGATLATDPGYVFGLALATRDVSWLAARAAWRRVFDASDLQREEAGVAASVQPGGGTSLSGRLRYDAIFLRVAEAGLGAALRLGDAARVALEWVRARPTFSADSIWNAFGVEPYDAARATAHAALGPWRLTTDGGARVFDTGDPAATTPGDPRDPPAAPAERHPVAWDAALRVERDVVSGPHPGHVGAEGRLGGGYGGARHHGDLYARLPVPLAPGNPPLALRARLGAIWLDDPERDARDTVSGWGLLAAEWPAAEGIWVEGVLEGSVSDDVRNPWRFRGLAQLRFEDWW